MLGNILSVQREVGLTRSTVKPSGKIVKKHFIIEDLNSTVCLGKTTDGVYPVNSSTQILASDSNGITVAANSFYTVVVLSAKNRVIV